MGGESECSAREWLVVRQAEMQLLEGNVLIPHTSMGAEDREQIKGPIGLEEARTKPDHPLVKDAEQFTLKFDVSAERLGEAVSFSPQG